MPDRRFRDMRLTEEEVGYHVLCHWPLSRTNDMNADGMYWKVEARAKRLLPLWREWGLRELRYSGWIDGHNHATKQEESPF